MPAPPPCPLQGQGDARAPIFNVFRGPGIESREAIPPAYAARRAGATTLFLNIFVPNGERSIIFKDRDHFQRSSFRQRSFQRLKEVSIDLLNLTFF